MKKIPARKQIITISAVKHIARLANIPLTPSEIRKFPKQLSRVVEYVNQLKKVNTKKIKPTSGTANLKNVFRDDIVAPSLSQEEVLSNAQDTHNGFFKIKAIFEEQ